MADRTLIQIDVSDGGVSILPDSGGFSGGRGSRVWRQGGGAFVSFQGAKSRDEADAGQTVWCRVSVWINGPVGSVRRQDAEDDSVLVAGRRQEAVRPKETNLLFRPSSLFLRTLNMHG